LPASIGRGWKCLTGTNALAYYDAKLITIVYGFIVYGI
jgi:hypothetical protein